MKEVYRAQFRFVWALLQRLGVHEADLEDVAQEVFIVAHRRLPQFEGRASIRTWLYAITVRVAANDRRRRRRDPELDGAAGVAVPALGSSDPEAHAERVQAAELLDQLLGRLDEKKRAVFVLADIEGLSAPEIARIVGTNSRTVHSRLRAARDRFRGDLARLHRRAPDDMVPAAWARRAAEGAGPGPGVDKRVWAALMLRLPPALPIAGGATAAWLSTAKAVALSTSLGAVGLGVIALAASPLRGPLRDNRIETRSGSRPAVDATAAVRPADARVTSASLAAGGTDSLGDGRRQAEPARAPRRGTARPPRPSPVPVPVSPMEDPDPDAMARELLLVGHVRRALAEGDPLAALRWADRHAEEFTTGEFRTECARSRIAALCALGRRADADAAARDAGVVQPCAGD